jgi:hypothetical protein
MMKFYNLLKELKFKNCQFKIHVDEYCLILLKFIIAMMGSLKLCEGVF